jgi:aldehyde:ferredoxin oxidoreductase
MNNIPEILTLATGIHFDRERLWRCFQRNRNLVRAVNVKRGMRRKDERPPEDHWAIRDEAFEQKLLDDYYAFKGWTKDGIPAKRTLDFLNLEFVSSQFMEKGILTGEEDVPLPVITVKNRGA